MTPIAYVAETGLVVIGSLGIALAEVSVGEGAGLGAVVGAAIVVGNHLITWALRWKKESTDNRNIREEAEQKLRAAREETEQKLEERRAGIERKARRDAFDEYKQAFDDLRSDREADREVMHTLREEFQQEKTDHALTKVRLDSCEKDRAELFRRVEALEKDRA